MAGDNVIKLTVTVDPTNANQALVDLGQQLVNVGGKGDTGAKVATGALLEMARAATQVRELLASLGQQLQTAGQQAASFGGAAASVKELGAAAGSAREAITGLGQQTKTVGEQAGGVDKASASVKDLGQASRQAKSEMGELTSSVDVLRDVLVALELAKAFREFVSAIRDAIQAVDDYRVATISIAANLTDMNRGTDAELRQIYAQNLRYAEETYAKVEAEAAKHFASGREIIEGWQILTNKGITLTNDRDIENLGVIIDKIKLMTQGQSSSLQIAQELRSVITGQARAGDQLAMLLRDRLGPEWEKQLNDAREQGRTLEFLREQFGGLAAAQEDVGNTINSQMSTMSTTMDQIKRSGFKEMWQDVAGTITTINRLLAENKRLIGSAIARTYAAFKDAWQALPRNFLQILTPGFDQWPGGPNLKKRLEQENAARTEEEDRRRLGVGDAQPVVTNKPQVYPDGISKDRQTALARLGVASAASTVEKRLASVDKQIVSEWEQTWKDYKGGLLTENEYWTWVGKSNSLRANRRQEILDRDTRKGASAATAGARADIKASGVLQKIEDEIAAYEQSLGGDRLGAAIAKIEREHNQALTRIQADLVGAKGGVEALHQAEARLGDLKALKIKAAELAEYSRQLDDAAKHESSLYRDTYGAQGSQLKADWLQGYKQYLQELQQGGYGTDLADPQKIATAEERWRAHEQFMLDEDVRRLGEGGKLSDEYWDAEGRRLDAHLDQVKKHVSDENAFQVYASQQRSELRRKELEARLGYEDDFLGYLRDYLALEFKAYQDETARKRAMWQDMAKSTADYIRQVGGDVQTGIADTLTNLWEGNAQKARESWANMWTNLVRDTIRYVTSLAATLAKNALLMPIVAKVVGTDTSALQGLTGLSASADQGQTSGSGFSLSDLFKNGGSAKTTYDMVNTGGTWTLNTGQAEMYETLVAAGKEPAAAWQSAMNLGQASSTSTLSNIMSVAGPALASGGIGYAAGGFIRPDNPTASYVGAGTGLLAGGVASATGLGATIGGALGIGAGLAATGVGALVAIPAALLAGALTPNTETSKWVIPAASKQALMFVDGELVPSSYGTITTTSREMFGDSSTRHSTIYSPADATMATAEAEAWEKATAGLTDFADALGLSEDALKASQKGFSWDVTAIPEGHEAEVYRNLANAMSQYSLTSLGLLDQVQAVAAPDEAWIDTLSRLSSAMTSMDAIARATGYDFDGLTQGLTKIQAADYVSQLSDALGSMDAVQTALGLLTKHTTDDAGLLQARIDQSTMQVGPALAQLGTDVEGFWSAMQAATTNGPLDPDIFAAWSEAATQVDAIDTLADSLQQVEAQADQTATSMRQLGLSLEARALTAHGLDWQASQVSLLAQQEAELAQARQAGYDAATMARIAEVQALETAAAIRQHQEEVDSTRSSLLSRIASATGDTMYEIYAMVASRYQDYVALEREYGEEIAALSNDAYNAEINAKLAAMAESKRLAEESFRYDIQARKLVLEGRDHEAGAVKLLAQQAQEFQSAVASGLGAIDLSTVLDVQRQELTKYWDDLVDDLQDAADAIHKTVVELRGGDQSPLLPDQKYAILRSQFDADLAKGLTGDRDAISEAQSLATSVLSAKMDATTDPAEYTKVFNEITSALGLLAEALLGQQQADTIAEAEATYQQAVQQASQVFAASLEGQITQALAYTGAGAEAAYHLGDTNTPDGSPTWDAYLRSHPDQRTNYLSWWQQSYGISGDGQYDAWSILSGLISRGITPAGTGDLYQAALDALDNLKSVRGYATGTITSGPELAMIGEAGTEAVIPMPSGRVPVQLLGGSNAAVVAAIRSLEAAVARLTDKVGQGNAAISSNTRDVVSLLRRCGGDEGVITTRVEAEA